ncbi:MAG: DUF362 domain-containing protein [Thermodesulfobacteriota bacterium]
MKVSVVKDEACYPKVPFHPSECYPEYPFPSKYTSKLKNPVYDAVRQAFYLLGLDSENFGTSSWNPLRDLVKEGSKIIIKPNFVNHYNPASDERTYFQALVSQGAVIRPILDYVLLAAKDKYYELTIADLPMQGADFQVLCRESGVESILRFIQGNGYAKGEIKFLDLRDYRLRAARSGAVIGKVKLSGDPLGYLTVNLGENSSLVPLERYSHLFRVSDYTDDAAVEMHCNGNHHYILPRTILESDLIINVPKLKVHRKAGVTLSLKNLVGVIGYKGCLPHFRAGSTDAGGDEYPIPTVINSMRSKYDFALRNMGRTVWGLARPLGRILLRLDQRLHRDNPLAHIISGDWYGNDTVWRMVHDLNRIIFHADAKGILHDEPQRRYLTIVDGIVGGECEGPLKPKPVKTGLIVVGFDPIAVDVTCAQLMGLDWRKIPQFARYNSKQRYPFSRFNGDTKEINLVASGIPYNGLLESTKPVHTFEPASGWKGHIELSGLEPHGGSGSS